MSIFLAVIFSISHYKKYAMDILIRNLYLENRFFSRGRRMVFSNTWGDENIFMFSSPHAFLEHGIITRSVCRVGRLAAALLYQERTYTLHSQCAQLTSPCRIGCMGWGV